MIHTLYMNCQDYRVTYWECSKASLILPAIQIILVVLGAVAIAKAGVFAQVGFGWRVTLLSAGGFAILLDLAGLLVKKLETARLKKYDLEKQLKAQMSIFQENGKYYLDLTKPECLETTDTWQVVRLGQKNQYPIHTKAEARNIRLSENGHFFSFDSSERGLSDVVMVHFRGGKRTKYDLMEAQTILNLR